MAEFNPGIQEGGVPNLTSVSHGTGANRTFETIFSGLTDTFMEQQVIKDQQTQDKIYDEASAGFEETNQEFGLSADEEQTPGAMKGDLTQMQTLQNAFEQGKISQVNYYGRLANLSKQLRSKYPGYEKIVDATIMSVTGTRPANAYRDALLGMIDAQNEAASSEDKFRRQFVKDKGDVLSLLYGDDFFADPSKFDFNKVQADVYAFEAKTTANKAALQELDMRSKTADFNVEQGKRQANREFNLMVQTSLNKSMNLNSPGGFAKIEEFVQKGGGSAQEIDGFIKNISSAEGQVRSSLIQRANFYVSKGYITQADANKLIDDAMYPITQAKEAVLGGDFKLASKYATLNKAMEDEAMNDLLQDPTIRIGNGLSKINQSLGEEFLTKSGKVNDIAAEVAGQSMRPETDPKTIEKAYTSGNQKVARETFSVTFDKVMTSPNLSREDLSEMIKKYYTKGGIDMLSPKVINREDHQQVFLKMLDPRITKNIMEKGSDEDKAAYVAWAYEKMKAVPEFRAAAGTVNSVDETGQFEIIFDPTAFKLKIVEGGNLDKNNPSYRRRMSAVQNEVAPFARVLDAMKPLAELEGMTPDEAAKKIGRTFGVDIEIASDKKGISTPDSATPIDPIDFFEEEDEEYDIHDQDMFDGPEATPGNAMGFVDMKSGEGGDKGSLPTGGLISSSKRGYNPDLKNLRGEMTSGLSDLQEKWGRPLPIVSGYRSPSRNRKAGGAKKSQHMHGNAVDIDVSNLSIDERKDLIKLARKNGFTGVGVYTNSLHLDKGGERAWGPSYKRASLPKWARDVL